MTEYEGRPRLVGLMQIYASGTLRSLDRERSHREDPSSLVSISLVSILVSRPSLDRLQPSPQGRGLALGVGELRPRLAQRLCAVLGHRT
jgi:hypothetical protein